MALSRGCASVSELAPRAAVALRAVPSRRDSGAAGAALRQRVTHVCRLRGAARLQRCCAGARAGARWAAGAYAPDCAADDGCRDEGAVTVRDDLDSLLQVLPPGLRSLISNHPRRGELVEVVLDLGRSPEIRGAQGYREVLRAEEITSAELEAAASAVGNFGGDNRAGIAGTLHRISAIRNRRGVVVGLTCRVGRAVSGHAAMVRDILDTRESMLFVGAPGVGKTTVLRDLARVLSVEFGRRVVIVDSSNELGGDSDVPHSFLGEARRMQVPRVEAQHEVMVEAVENHMPEVVIVDEVGTLQEALACRTIAERGVQLIATAHGRYIADVMKNPTLADLVGGVQSVTLGDDEARARGTQKSVLERTGPATFTTVIEMRERTSWVVHDAESSADALLAGKTPDVELRTRQADSQRVDVSAGPYDGGAGGPARAQRADEASWNAGVTRDKDSDTSRRGGAAPPRPAPSRRR